MKFVWKDDVLSSVTENRYTVKDDNNEVVYDGVVPVVGDYSEFYLNRVAQKLMHRDSVDFTTGVKQHPGMSIGLTVYNQSGTPVKYDVYVYAFLGEPIKQLSNPINGKLDPRMFFLWSVYNDFPTTIAINEPQPEPPSGFTIQLSGQTDFSFGEQSSEISVIQCTDWDGVVITQTGDWFNYQKTRNSVLLSINENSTYSARTGSLSFYYGGEERTAVTLTQSARTEPSEFVLELSGTTSFNYLYNISKLYVIECTDWNSVQVSTDESWVELTKQDNGVVVEVAVNFDSSSRTANIFFTYDNQIVKTVTIVQSMYDFTLELSGVTNFDSAQQVSYLELIECSDWNSVYMQQSGNWFTPTKTSTGVTLAINENTGMDDRTGSLQFFYDGQLVNQQNLKQQSAFAPYVNVSGDTSIDYQQQELNIYLISSNVWNDVTVSANTDWFTYTKNSTGVTLSVNQNAGSARTGQVEFKYNGSTLTTFSFTQDTHIVDNYLTTRMLSAGTIGISTQYGSTSIAVAYRKNGGEWVTGNTYPSYTFGVSVVAGDSVEWKIVNEITVSKLNSFYSDCPFNVEGNVMSLIYSDNYEGKQELTNNMHLRCLFSGSSVVDASSLLLPATALSYQCYTYMFNGCTGLTAAPALPATTLAEGCYMYMFKGCTNLTIAPELNAATLPTDAYHQMFSDCTSLNYIKCLAETFGNYSKRNWVQNVSSTGLFVKKTGVTWESGVNGIPNNWIVQEV